MKYDPYNLYRPADDSPDKKAFNSNVSFCNTAHEVSREDRQDKDDAITRMVQAIKNQISKGN